MNMNSKIVARVAGIALIAAAFAVPKVFAAEPSDSVRTQTLNFEDLSLGAPDAAVVHCSG